MSHLPTKWAERDDRLFITIEASSATDVHVTFSEKSIAIRGKGITAKASQPHELNDELHLVKEIDPAASTYKVLGVSIQICAIKKDTGYWNQLVAQPAKETKSWLSVDWNMWKDEDDDEDNKGGMGDFGGYGDLSSMMGGMGGMGGIGDMGNMGGMPDLPEDDEPLDSDDESDGGDDGDDDDDDAAADIKEPPHGDDAAASAADDKAPAAAEAAPPADLKDLDE